MSQASDRLKAFTQKGKNLEAEMSFFDHFDVLRKLLIRSAIAIVLFAILAFVYYDVLFDGIIMAPKRADFWTYRMLCLLANRWHLGEGFCVKDIPFTIINTQMAGQFTLQMNSALLAGLVLGIPYTLWELWRFIKPGLSATERQHTSGFVGYTSMLFVIGILFGYYVITPLSVNFLANYRISTEIQNQITIDSYLSTVATLTLASGLVFELPMVVYILSKMGIMTPAFMRKNRRYAIVINLIVAAVVTPTPDMLTMLTVSFPLLLLYELSILVSARVQKRRLQIT